MDSSYDPDKDPREWFKRVHSFYEGAKRLSYLLYAAPKAEKRPELFEAYSVLIALAVEAFIKCLYVIQLAKRPSGDNLLQLYNSLRKEDKTEIKNNYDAIASKSDRLKKMHTYNPDVPLDLISVLERTHNAFVHYRYPSKGKSGAYGLQELASALKQHISKLWPASHMRF